MTAERFETVQFFFTGMFGIRIRTNITNSDTTESSRKFDSNTKLLES